MSVSYKIFVAFRSPLGHQEVEMLFFFGVNFKHTEWYIILFYFFQAVFHIKGGSGHFAVKGSSNAIAKVNYQGKTDILVS